MIDLTCPHCGQRIQIIASQPYADPNDLASPSFPDMFLAEVKAAAAERQRSQDDPAPLPESLATLLRLIDQTLFAPTVPCHDRPYTTSASALREAILKHATHDDLTDIPSATWFTNLLDQLADRCPNRITRAYPGDASRTPTYTIHPPA